MKRILIFFLVIGITAISSVSMAAMSNSRIRKETRFLTDKMAYELNLSTGQYNDVYARSTRATSSATTGCCAAASAAPGSRCA